MLPLIIIKISMNIIMKEIMIEKNVSVRISIRILYFTFYIFMCKNMTTISQTNFCV
jgi:hypothetical protein